MRQQRTKKYSRAAKTHTHTCEPNRTACARKQKTRLHCTHSCGSTACLHSSPGRRVRLCARLFTANNARRDATPCVVRCVKTTPSSKARARDGDKHKKKHAENFQHKSHQHRNLLVPTHADTVFFLVSVFLCVFTLPLATPTGWTCAASTECVRCCSPN